MKEIYLGKVVQSNKGVNYLEYDENQYITGLVPNTRINDWDYAGYRWYPKCADIVEDYALGVSSKAFTQGRIRSITLTNVLVVESNAFYHETSSPDLLISINLPNATTIKSCAFYSGGLNMIGGNLNARLKTLNLPKATIIETGAFFKCGDDKLRTLNLNSLTVAEVQANLENWKLVISSYYKTEVVCSDGILTADGIQPL